MKNKGKHVKDILFFDLLMIFWLLVIIFIFSTTPNLSFHNYILISLLIINMIISYSLGLIEGLITSMIIIFIYGSYILYAILILGSITKFEFEQVLWLFLFPIGALIAGEFTTEFRELKTELERLKEAEKLVFIDEVTGFLNANGFFQRLEEETNRAKRLGEKLSVLYIKIADAKELKNVYKQKGYEEVLKTISEEIIKNTRAIDIKGIIDEETIGIILPETDFNSAEIVREKLHKILDRIIVEINHKKRPISLRLNIGIGEYNLQEDFLSLWERAKENSRYDV